MLLVALTGGVGAGKSTVAELLAGRGAVVLDADELARRAVEPGTDGLAKLVDEFGPGILDDAGSLNRAEMARRAFSDPGVRRRLEAVVHPEVARLFAEEVEAHRATDEVLVYSVPLLVEGGLAGAFDVVVTVSAPLESRIARLVGSGRMTEEDARGRAAAQASDEEREAAADHVLVNAGDLDELRAATERLWEKLRIRAN